jgi:hypothetical protein
LLSEIFGLAACPAPAGDLWRVEEEAADLFSISIKILWNENRSWRNLDVSQFRPGGFVLVKGHRE